MLFLYLISHLLLNRDGSSIFGHADSVISEQHLEKSFGVNVKIKEFYHSDKKYTSVFPIAL